MKQTFKFQIALLALSLPLVLNAQTWNLSGNAGTVSTNFFGTTDNKDLRIRTNNSTRITVKNNGRVGIGINAPVTKLQVYSSALSPVSLTADGLVVFGDKVGFNIAFDPQNIQGRNNGAGATLYQNFYGGDIQLGASGVPLIYKEISGNVGIGTLAPAEKLEVSGNIRLTRGGARSLYIDDAAAGTNGSDLTVQAGGTPIFGGGPTSGGNLSITAGNTNNASSQAGGNIVFTTGRNVWNNGVNPGAKHGDIIFRGGGAGLNTTIVEHARIDGTTGAMALGTATPSTGYRLTVAGKIICTELKVQAQPFPDYVFDSGYQLKTIDQVEQHITSYKRLPGMPSACEVETNGMSVGEMQTKTVEKVEEMMLYIIQLKKQNEDLQQRLEILEKK